MDNKNITEFDRKVMEGIMNLFRDGHLTIQINVEPRYAEAGDGQWNVTRGIIRAVGQEHIELSEGSVEIIEGR